MLDRSDVRARETAAVAVFAQNPWLGRALEGAVRRNGFRVHSLGDAADVDRLRAAEPQLRAAIVACAWDSAPAQRVIDELRRTHPDVRVLCIGGSKLPGCDLRLDAGFAPGELVRSLMLLVTDLPARPAVSACVDSAARAG